MSIWDSTRSASSIKADVLAKLRELGATRMEASYSGGNDEGGVDSVDVLRPAGKSDYLMYELYQRPIHEQVNGKWTQTGYEWVRNYWPSAGPFPNKKAALAWDDPKRKPDSKYEPVKVEPGTDVKLVDAEGDWNDENSLHNMVDDLLSIDFDTWAGDFSASGTVYADVAEGRVWREGSVSTYVDDPEAGEY